MAANKLLRKARKEGVPPPATVAALEEIEQTMELETIFTYRKLGMNVLATRDGKLPWINRILPADQAAKLGGAPESPITEEEIQRAFEAQEAMAQADEEAARQLPKEFVLAHVSLATGKSPLSMALYGAQNMPVLELNIHDLEAAVAIRPVGPGVDAKLRVRCIELRD